VADAQQMQGLYESSRRVQSSFASLVDRVAQQVDVTATSEGDLVVDNPAFFGRDGKPKLWREVGPFVWREVGGPDRLAAKVVDGRVVMLGMESSNAETVYQPVPAWRASSWNLPLFLAAVVILLATALSWPIGVIMRWSLKRAPSLSGRDRLVLTAAKSGAVLGVAYVVAWAMTFQAMVNDLSVMSSGLDPWLRTLQAMGLLVSVGAAAALANLILSFRSKRPWLARAGALLLVVALADLVWVSFAFRLITPSLDY
jgi:hypothetical protein